VRKIINLREFATAAAQKSSCAAKKERKKQAAPLTAAERAEAVAAGIAQFILFSMN
jgi:hypothetical protein